MFSPTVRVLVATTFLNCLTGSELFVYDLARGLQQRGHGVTVWVRDLVAGAPLPRLLAHNGVRVTGDLPPEGSTDAVILQLAGMFPVFAERHLDVPRMAVCHGPKLPAEVAPPDLPRTLHLALTREGDHWLRRSGYDRVAFTGYGIDLNRFRPAGPLPQRPRRAVIHSKYADVELVRAACERAGVELVELGTSSWRDGFGADHFSRIVEVRDDGTVIDHRPEVACFHVERTIATADVVLGLGRSAVEALAMGRNCIVFGYDDVGDGRVTDARLPSFSGVNFSSRARGERYDADSLAAELIGCDPAQGARNRAFAEQHYSLERFLDRIEALLVRELRGGRGRIGAAAFSRSRMRPFARRPA